MPAKVFSYTVYIHVRDSYPDPEAAAINASHGIKGSPHGIVADNVWNRVVDFIGDFQGSLPAGINIDSDIGGTEEEDMPDPPTFFVKDGLLNGEEGVMATKCGGNDEPTLEDGWYFIRHDEEDGIGPYDTKELAIDGFYDHDLGE